MSATFPETAVTLIAKIKDLGPASDSAAWVRFWNAYSGAIRQFAAMKGGEENADDIVMLVLGKLVDVLRKGQYTPEKGRFHSYLATMIVNEVHMLHRRNVARGNDRRVSIDALHDDHDGLAPHEQHFDQSFRRLCGHVRPPPSTSWAPAHQAPRMSSRPTLTMRLSMRVLIWLTEFREIPNVRATSAMSRPSSA